MMAAARDDGSSTPVEQQHLAPDTEEHVEEESENVVRNFMLYRYQQDVARNPDTPGASEFQGLTTNPLSDSSQVGRRLAIIGDDIDAKYGSEIKELVKRLKLTQNTAYEAFASVARRIFSENINWGRIVALLSFGYRIGMDVLNKGLDFFSKVVNFIVRFIVGERIAAWIATQGGWIAVLSYPLEEFQPTTKGVIFFVGLFAASVLAALYFRRR